jgi:hypothetical protein
VLSTRAGDHPATLIDISRTGARLGGTLLPGAGEELTFRADDVSAAGQVVWSELGVCAIAFDTPIAAAEVLQLRSQGVLGAEACTVRGTE